MEQVVPAVGDSAEVTVAAERYVSAQVVTAAGEALANWDSKDGVYVQVVGDCGGAGDCADGQ